MRLLIIALSEDFWRLPPRCGFSKNQLKKESSKNHKRLFEGVSQVSWIFGIKLPAMGNREFLAHGKKLFRERISFDCWNWYNLKHHCNLAIWGMLSSICVYKEREGNISKLRQSFWNFEILDFLFSVATLFTWTNNMITSQHDKAKKIFFLHCLSVLSA